MRSRSSAPSALTSRPGASRRTSGKSMFMLRRSVSTASATPGYWTLTATSRPSCVRARWTWPIDAAATGSRLNSAKTCSTGPPSSVAQQLLELGERHRRRGVAQRGEALLELLALVLGDEVEVDGREDLADLHRRALHLPELLDELVGDRDRVVALERRPRDHRPEAGGPGDAGGRELGHSEPEYGRAAPADQASTLRAWPPPRCSPSTLRRCSTARSSRCPSRSPTRDGPAGQRAAGHREPRAVGRSSSTRRARSSCASAPRRRRTAPSCTRPTTPTARRCPTSSRTSGPQVPEFFERVRLGRRRPRHARGRRPARLVRARGGRGRRRGAALHGRPRHVPVRVRPREGALPARRQGRPRADRARRGAQALRRRARAGAGLHRAARRPERRAARREGHRREDRQGHPARARLARGRDRRVDADAPADRRRAARRRRAELRAFREIATLVRVPVDLPPDRPTDWAGGAAAARERGMERLAARLDKLRSAA